MAKLALAIAMALVLVAAPAGADIRDVCGWAFSRLHALHTEMSKHIYASSNMKAFCDIAVVDKMRPEIFRRLYDSDGLILNECQSQRGLQRGLQGGLQGNRTKQAINLADDIRKRCPAYRKQ